MKNPNLSLKKYIVAGAVMLSCVEATAQFCNNRLDTVYGLTAAGEMYPINVNNATAGTMVGTTLNGINANGIGHSSLDSRFYFFNRCNTGVLGDTIQFVAFNPVTGVKQVLPDPPATFTVSTKNRSGTVTRDGSSYYAINPGATGGPALYRYSLGSNSWTTITQTFKDKSGNVVAPITSLNSGDMAFDGNDNLWIVVATNTQYALYKINAPVPISFVANVVVDTIIPVTSNPISGGSITGIAFNSAGKLFLSTGAGVNPANNKLYRLATTGSALVLVGSIPNGYGDDLTSCSYPQKVLSVGWVNFTASLRNNAINLVWQVNEQENVSGYEVQHSADGQNWKTLQYLNKDSRTSDDLLKTYSYSNKNYQPGTNYYRILEVDAGGKKTVSPVRVINTNDLLNIDVGPNPAKDVLYLNHKSTSTNYLAQIFDKTGRMIYSTMITPAQQSLNIGYLSSGMYILKLSASSGEEIFRVYKFIKG